MPRAASSDSFQALPASVPETERRIGVEIEFMGPSARRAAQALAADIGGDVVAEDAHAFAVRGTVLGDMAVELDLRYAHPQRHGKTLPVRIGPKAAAGLGWLVSGVVPRELIIPPLPVERLAEVDHILDVLRAAGAGGRGATLFGSLGLHFNIEAPAADLRRITAVMVAFGLMEPWLRREIAQGRSRLERHLPPPYPPEFLHRIAAPDYRPDQAGLIDDYLAANPTRDRGLDLLPLLLSLDAPRVRARLPYEKIASRPVFHYRLPLAHLGETGWSIAADWNRWVAVERLASDAESLAAAARAYRAEGSAWPAGGGPLPRDAAAALKA
ncbi:amidoligase family protein [Inquilinus limosus]|uniref:amidoligase family protein n=1 Tax=Inquilinus limosus TaxID=171674 RepID=UPI00040B0058|nr:amidoligase family protein [Inquilinus limosus]